MLQIQEGTMTLEDNNTDSSNREEEEEVDMIQDTIQDTILQDHRIVIAVQNLDIHIQLEREVDMEISHHHMVPILSLLHHLAILLNHTLILALAVVLQLLLLLHLL